MNESGIETAKPNRSALSASLFTTTFALIAIGVVAVTSATASPDGLIFDLPWWQTTVGRQVAFLLFALGLLVGCFYLTPLMLRSEAWRKRICLTLFIVTIVALVATWIPGLARSQRGSDRWITVFSSWGGVSFQPSEFAKLALVFLLAWLAADRVHDIRSFWRGFVPLAGAIALCVALVGKEDFGTAALIGAVGGLTLLVAGCRLRHCLLLLLAAIGGFVGLLFLAPYRIDRLTSFMDIWADPQGHGYQPIQSLATIASGGWLGQGLGAGVQKFGYLPEGHTDFVFSVICEEMGALGGLLLIGLYAAFVLLGLMVVWRARTPFERILAFGITATIGMQAAMNIAVVTAVAPTTGISLPFISAGGSGLVAACISVGVLLAVAKRANAPLDDRLPADIEYPGDASEITVRS